MRLLKEFSPMHFNTRIRRSDDLGRKQPPVKIEERGQIGLLVELPVEHQTFEVCKVPSVDITIYHFSWNFLCNSSDMVLRSNSEL